MYRVVLRHDKGAALLKISDTWNCSPNLDRPRSAEQTLVAVWVVVGTPADAGGTTFMGFSAGPVAEPSRCLSLTHARHGEAWVGEIEAL